MEGACPRALGSKFPPLYSLKKERVINFITCYGLMDSEERWALTIELSNLEVSGDLIRAISVERRGHKLGTKGEGEQKN